MGVIRLTGMSLIRLHVPQSVIEIVNVFNANPFVDAFSIMESSKRHKLLRKMLNSADYVISPTHKSSPVLTCHLQTSSSLQHIVHSACLLPLLPGRLKGQGQFFCSSPLDKEVSF